MWKLHGLARWISKFGLMTRSDAERAVTAGQVTLNGKVERDPERASNPDRDRIEVNGRPLRQEKKVYLALHKPVGPITTSLDPLGRTTAYDFLPAKAGRVQAVGRLDADTSGLLLFTNDTEFAARVTNSEGEVEKVYEALVAGRVETASLRQFEAGVVLDGKPTRPAKARVLEALENATRVEVTLTEGRNRQVRRMWELLGHRVTALHRIRVGPVRLGDLAEGRSRPVTEWEREAILQAWK